MIHEVVFVLPLFLLEVSKKVLHHMLLADSVRPLDKKKFKISLIAPRISRHTDKVKGPVSRKPLSGVDLLEEGSISCLASFTTTYSSQPNSRIYFWVLPIETLVPSFLVPLDEETETSYCTNLFWFVDYPNLMFLFCFISIGHLNNDGVQSSVLFV